ncbi:MAG: hypothetical protein JO091_02225 [Acidobacteriaceae bacterium]|nr:hypothetical protein [Acidobacteriaceae bacterium]
MFLLAACSLLTAADFPQAEISNGLIQATLYLPDPDRGYYRGSRFDWSGVVASLTYRGHNYFGRWFEHYDPRLHDAISGPVEEFVSEDGALGYANAKPGELFIKIGVGLLRKPDDSKYTFVRPYDIVSPGRRIVRPEADRVEFVHELSDDNGYAYVYRKTVRLAGKKPLLIIEHSLKNTGHKTIETSVYNHVFFVLDGQPTGPAVSIQFGFTPRATNALNGLAEIRGDQLVYLQTLAKGQRVATDVTGFSSQAHDNHVRVENHTSGAAVDELGDHPLSRLHLWSIRSTVCPEAYIHLKIPPKHETHWRITYTFSTLAP